MNDLFSTDREKLKQIIKHTIKRSKQPKTTEGIKEVHQDTGEIKKELDELNRKLDELIKIKTAHDKRVLELEQKIKARVSNNFLELMKIEQHLGDLEEHFDVVKKKGYDKTIIDEIRDKIVSLRGKVKEKKTRMAMDQMTYKPIPRPKIVMPPQSLKPMIRHEMHFKPKKTQPPMPPAPPIPPITPPFIKKEPKKGFFKFFKK